MKKLIASLLCLCLLLSAAACTQEPDKAYEKQKALYDDIITEYKSLLTAKQNGEDLPALDTKGMDDRETAIAEAIHGTVDACKQADGMGYGYKDMDGNGTPELILLTTSSVPSAIFTLRDKKPVLLEAAYGENGRFYFGRGNNLHIVRASMKDGVRESTYYICHVEDGAMVYDVIYGDVYNVETKTHIERFQMVDGERQIIDDETYRYLDSAYSEILFSTSAGEIFKWAAPRIIPAIVEIDEGSLPKADFSSYEAIKATFMEMHTQIPDYKESDWFLGNYDHLFAFASDEDFDTYIRLLYLTGGGGKGYGTCETDMNGDGKDELLIMTDRYDILAIFTTVDGKVMPVEGYFDLIKDWGIDGITADGKIHSWRRTTTGLGTERVMYQISTEGKLETILSIGEIWFTDDTGYYKVENGQRVDLTQEEYTELERSFDVFDIQSHGTDREVIRNVTGITFTPLYEKAKPSELDTPVTWENLQLSSLHFTLGTVHSDEEVAFRLNQVEGYGEEQTEEKLISAKATLTDGKYVFDDGNTKGYLEFGVDSVWLIVESCEDGSVTPRAYLFYWEAN